jgi:hypothetical protein
LFKERKKSIKTNARLEEVEIDGLRKEEKSE